MKMLNVKMKMENAIIFQARSLCSLTYIYFLDVVVLSVACESFIVPCH